MIVVASVAQKLCGFLLHYYHPSTTTNLDLIQSFYLYFMTLKNLNVSFVILAFFNCTKLYF